ncbi:hypothetical protein D3C80_1654140 [compost metagenome]
MGGHHHGHAFLDHAVDVQPKLAAGDGIHAGSRFVEKQNVRLVHQRTGQRQPLLKPERQFIRGVGSNIGQAKRIAHAGDFLVLRFPAQAIHAGEKSQILFNGEVAVQREFLRHIAQMLARFS